jgi:hypothetical protein
VKPADKLPDTCGECDHVRFGESYHSAADPPRDECRHPTQNTRKLLVVDRDETPPSECVLRWERAVAEHLPTFKRHGFDTNSIDFSGVKTEVIEAMANALIALEEQAAEDEAWLSAAGQLVCASCLADLPFDFASNLCAACVAKGVR